MKTTIYATTKQLAEYYGVAYRTVRKFVQEMQASGFGGVIYVGRLPRIDAEKFQEYLEIQTEQRNDIKN